MNKTLATFTIFLKLRFLKNLLNSKWFKYPFYFIVIVFSLIGMILTITYSAIQFGFTKEAGEIDLKYWLLYLMLGILNQFQKVILELEVLEL